MSAPVFDLINQENSKQSKSTKCLMIFKEVTEHNSEVSFFVWSSCKSLGFQNVFTKLHKTDKFTHKFHKCINEISDKTLIF